jgi:hypothetical protein
MSSTAAQVDGPGVVCAEAARSNAPQALSIAMPPTYGVFNRRRFEAGAATSSTKISGRRVNMLKID